MSPQYKEHGDTPCDVYCNIPLLLLRYYFHIYTIHNVQLSHSTSIARTCSITGAMS